MFWSTWEKSIEFGIRQTWIRIRALTTNCNPDQVTTSPQPQFPCLWSGNNNTNSLMGLHETIMPHPYSRGSHCLVHIKCSITNSNSLSGTSIFFFLSVSWWANFKFGHFSLSFTISEQKLIFNLTLELSDANISLENTNIKIRKKYCIFYGGIICGIEHHSNFNDWHHQPQYLSQALTVAKGTMVFLAKENTLDVSPIHWAFIESAIMPGIVLGAWGWRNVSETF